MDKLPVESKVHTGTAPHSVHPMIKCQAYNVPIMRGASPADRLLQNLLQTHRQYFGAYESAAPPLDLCRAKKIKSGPEKGKHCPPS